MARTGPAKAGGVIQERADAPIPACPAGKEVVPRPEASKKPEPPKPEDKPQQGDQPPPQPKDEQQKQLSKEELTRLLDKLQQLEEQAAKLRAQIHKARRVAVKKDW